MNGSTSHPTFTVPGRGMRLFCTFSCKNEMIFRMMSEKLQPFLGKMRRLIFPFFVCSCMAWKYGKNLIGLCVYSTYSHKPVRYRFFRVAPQAMRLTSHLIWSKSEIFHLTFRILTGPGFCLRFILQTPGWVCAKSDLCNWFSAIFRCEWDAGEMNTKRPPKKDGEMCAYPYHKPENISLLFPRDVSCSF